MSYSNYQLNQKINNLQNQINNLDVAIDLQTVLYEGNTAVGSIELTDIDEYALYLDPSSLNMTATDDTFSRLESTKLIFGKNTNYSTLEYTNSTDTLDITTTNINLNGQVTFDTPPHSVTPILGDDLTTKGYVDSLVGQYSGGYNLYLNYSETLVVNSITYNYLSNQISSATQQDLVITTDGTDQLLATFITDELNLSVIPAGLWSMVLYGAVSGAGGVLYYYFKIKKYSAGTITDIITSGFSPDVNATPTGNPDAYHMNATIDTPINISLTDRIIIEIYCKKISGVDVQLNTYFESAYYSFIQTSLNAGTTLLTSDNNWTGNNNFAIIPTTITTTAGSNNTQITTTAYIYNALLNYLTTATASSTYLTIANALTTYLSIATASTTYLTIANALSTYLTIATASSTYAPKASPTFTGIVNSASIINSGSIEANIFKNNDESFKTNGSGKITGSELVLGTGNLTSCGSITASGEIGGLSFKNTSNNFSASSAGAISGVSLSTSSNITSTGGYVQASSKVNCDVFDSLNATGGEVSLFKVPTTRSISIANTQTTGSLFFASGARSTANSGTINFCNNGASKNNIYIGNGAVNATTQTQTYGQGTWTFSNAPLSVTPTSGDNSLKLSTTEYVQTALGSYLTTASASSLYATIVSLGNYLTTASASATYLTIANASSTYALITSLSNYLTTATASTTYAPLTNPTIVNNLTLGSGDFDVLSGTMRSSGNITSTSGSLIAGTLRNTLNNASISSAGVITGTSVVSPSLTTGSSVALNVGTSTASSLNLGYSSITTTVAGVLKTTNNSLITGRTSAFDVDSISLPQSLSSTTVNSDVYINIFGGLTPTGNYIILNDFSSGQRITIKNGSLFTQTIAFTTKTIILNTASSGVSSVSLQSGAILDFYLGVTSWIQMNASESLSLSSTLTTNNLITTNPITLPTLTTTPTTTQLGYFASNISATQITVTSTTQAPASATVTNLPIGIYMFNYYSVSYTPSIGASQVMTYTISTTGGATSNIPQFVFSGVATTHQSSQRLSGIVKCTTATNTISMNFIVSAGGGTILASFYGYNYIKIA